MSIVESEDQRSMSQPNKKPTLAIIGGTGKEGMGLAFRWAAAGYQVIIGSRQIERAENAARTINERLAIESVIGLENREAARRADICVLTVIQTVHRHALEALKDDLQGKILVDATSRVDYRDPKPPQPPSAAQLAQEYLGPNVKIVAAFQTVPARILSSNVEQGGKADVLICSDDAQAAEQVIILARSAGMNGYYAGSLENAIIVESLPSILISINKYYHVKDATLKISGVNNQ